MRARVIPVITGLLILVSVTACSVGDEKPSVVTAFYPAQYLVERIAGEDVAITTLAQPGVQPHGMPLTSKQSTAVVDADLLVYLQGFQPAVDDHAAHHMEDSSHTFSLTNVPGPKPLLDTSGQPVAGAAVPATVDPHVWLDPTRYARIADALAWRLGSIDPAHKADYSRRARKLAEELKQLDGEYAAGLADCTRRELVVSHAAFGYLAMAYRLKQLPIAGLSPDQKPTRERTANVAADAKRHGATVIFFDPLTGPVGAASVAKTVGARVEPLDPIEGPVRGSRDDYLSLMRRNLRALRAALDCS